MRRWGIAAGVVLGAALGLTLGFIAWPVDPGHVAADFAWPWGRSMRPSSLRPAPRP